MPGESDKDSHVSKISRPHKLYVVGIGASAGGLEAMRELLSNLDYNPRLTYVVAQHLSPTHSSMLKTLLARECKLTVEDITDNQVPEPNTIYITPPNSDVEIREGVIRLVNSKKGVGPKPNINRFFASLAQDMGENAIGLILSGTGADGASGLLAIKTAGGTTFVQDPATAKYDGMPLAAIQSMGADVILPAAKLSKALVDFVCEGALILERPVGEEESSYEQIISLTRDITGFNLSQYKTSTIERRIKRRMALYHLVNMDDYLKFLREHQDEVEQFAKDVLISVTEFFRDTEAFDRLAGAIRNLVESAPGHQPLRAWVPGCATGEEAYSIAILFEEAIRELGKTRVYQVFASDIDSNATNKGRAGRFPVSSLERIDRQIVDRYFLQDGGDYVADKRLRENIVFSVHNLIMDPPFSRVDLISCRNLLIYFTAPLQKRVMEIFHYSLNPNGILFLGKSETVGQHEDLFASIDKSKRIYKKIGDRRIYRPFSAGLDLRSETPSYREISERPAIDPVGVKLNDTLQKAYAPPSIVISANDEMINSVGDITGILTIRSGPTGLNIFNLIDNKLRAELRALIFKCRREQKPVLGARHTLSNAQNKEIQIRLSVRNLEDDNSDLLVISFEPVEDKLLTLKPMEDATEQPESLVVLELEHELATTREHLQTVVEELETSNEELQSLNEELQSSNEELQSTNEELQTSNEELQSTNEELLTVNDELNVKSRELEILTNDLQNIQDSIDFPLIVVDLNLRVTRFVPATDQVVPLKNLHVGEVITGLPWYDEIPKLRQSIENAIKTRRSIAQETRIRNRFYQLRITPFTMKDGEVAGALLLFPETTELLEVKQSLQQSEGRLKNIIDNIVDGVVTISDRGKILSFSKAAQDIFGYSSKQVIGKNVSILMSEPDAEKHSTYLQNYLETGNSTAIGKQREVVAKHRDGTTFPIELSVNEMKEDDKIVFTGLIRDITRRKKMEEALYQEKERALVTLHSIADGVITTDREGLVEYVNGAAEGLTGWSNEEANNQPIGKIFKIIDEYTREPKINSVQKVLDKQQVIHPISSSVLRNKDGHEFAIEHSAAPIFNSKGELDGIIMVLRDITEKHQILKQMAWQARHDPLTGLINRREMENRIESAITSAKSFSREHALLYIDLDQFKVVNDTCGHQAGDELLRQISSHLSANIRHRDALSRLGGDEFGLLLENCSISQAQQIAESIKDNIEEYRFVWDGSVFKIGASIGVVGINSECTDMTQVMCDADTACYDAKESGRNRIKLHLPNDDGIVRQRRDMQWVTDINKVLDENRFTLYFQRINPLVEQGDPHWEVLLRMLDTDNNEITLPGVFLPAAERYGLMLNIDRWVLRTALSILKKVPEAAQNSTPRVSINLSGNSIGDEKFLTYVTDQFTTFSVSPSQVCFEITETAAIANFARAKEFINTMKKLGCSFALDDFGSGMSSFGYLKNLDVDYIKIDGSFVKNINRDVVDLAMVESINRIGHLMGIETVAEFAENDEIINKLRMIGVGYAQGNGIQRPIPTEEFLVTV